jgi:tRNA pseudouridine38-40 synthase
VRTLKLTIAYDGTRYVGWQRQAQGTSVQALIEGAIAIVEGRRAHVTGSGRTDAGVHAFGQVASVEIGHPIAIADLQRALNARLPSDVRIVALAEAPRGFNARFAARSKTYRYRIFPGETANPFERDFSWHVPDVLDAESMRAALGVMVGTHDFAAFQAAGSRVRTTVRTITAATLSRRGARLIGPGNDLVEIEVTGDGFLRHMVRNIVGTVVDVGQRRRSVDSVTAVLAGRDRKRAGPTAPAHGLFLVRVDYDDAAAP